MRREITHFACGGGNELPAYRKAVFNKINILLAPTYPILEVNLSALRHNLQLHQSFLLPSTKTMVMVKANAYGSGSVAVGRFLEKQRVDYLGVAFVHEGVTLRKAGIQLPILVLNPAETAFGTMLEFGLEPEIYSLGLLKEFLSFVKSKKRPSPAAGKFLIHLKLDTGMHRLGFEESDLEKLNALLTANNKTITVRSIFSHLAATEAVAHDDFTKNQIAFFNKMYKILAKELGYCPLRHVLNSGGIVRFPTFQMDMVRLGIGIYGTGPSGKIQKELQTVNTLKAAVSQIKKIKKGQTVGYGRAGAAKENMRIATLNIGYADGLPRKAGNGRFSVLINGQKAPTFGNVCMDMTMVDISKIKKVRAGDEALIFGKDGFGNELPVSELAQSMETIPYEIFTSVSARVKRVYMEGQSENLEVF